MICYGITVPINKATIRGNLFIGEYLGGSLGVQYHLGHDRWTAKMKN
jgi:hypothetical protein